MQQLIHVQIRAKSNGVWEADRFDGSETRTFYKAPPVVRHSVDTSGTFRVEAYGVGYDGEPVSLTIALVVVKVEAVNAD